VTIYEIEQYEIHALRYQVEADNEAEAIVKLLDGEGDPTDIAPEFVEVAEDMGLPVDECTNLAAQLRGLGVPVGDVVIPSIRSVKVVAPQSA